MLQCQADSTITIANGSDEALEKKFEYDRLIKVSFVLRDVVRIGLTAFRYASRVFSSNRDHNVNSKISLW